MNVSSVSVFTPVGNCDLFGNYHIGDLLLSGKQAFYVGSMVLYEEASLHECCAFVEIRIHAMFQFRHLTIKRATHLPVLTRAALTNFLIQCWTTICYEPQLSHAYPFLRHDGTSLTEPKPALPRENPIRMSVCQSNSVA